jgi:hypothetical protein
VSLRYETLRDPDGTAFHRAYDLLASFFLDRGELEEREQLATFVRQRTLRYAPGLEGAYHLVGVWDGDELVAARDCYVDFDLREQVCVVALAHTFVVPAWRRTGVAATLRTMPLDLARTAAAERYGHPVPTLVVAEMEPADPDDPDTVVRLVAYGRSGFSVLDPRRVPYSQPEFRDLPDAKHTGIPLLGVVRAENVPSDGSVPERLAAAFPRLFYATHRGFLPAARVDPSEAHVLRHLEQGGAPVPLLPLPTSRDTLHRLAPIVRGAVVPSYPPGLRGPDPRYGDAFDEVARVLAAWASAP